MKSVQSFSLFGAGVILILVLAVALTGCTQPSTPVTVTPTPAAGQVSETPVPFVTASLPYGVTISVPKDWERRDVLTSGVRDYGHNTVNIANFFSPNEVPGDSQSYNSLSIDVDQNVQEDFDQYFNNATLAIGKTYSTPINIQAHSYTLKISGYDSYELDFQSSDVKGTYIFTNTKGAIYIFAFKGPNKPLAVRALSAEITDTYKSIQLSPPGAVVTKQR
jgi:hypothetical protein